MSLLNAAARRAAPSLVRTARTSGRQQMRFAHADHFDTFAIDPNNKVQVYSYYVALAGALAAPAFAVYYQLEQGKKDKRHF